MTHQPNEQGVADWGAGWFRVDPESNCAVVTAGGDVDLRTAIGLHRAIQAGFQWSPCLVIEMSQVSFVDSTGLGVLIAARNRAAQSGGTVSLVAPPPLVRKLLAGTQLQTHLPVFDTLGQGLSAVTAV